MLSVFFKYLQLFGFLILCLNLPNMLVAQKYVLSNWTVEDGLSSNNVRGILQDQEGFMWFSTEHGLNKFDGYSFKKHRYNPNDSTSMGANFINTICKDDRGNIWVNLGVGVLSKYNKRSTKFTNYIFPDRNTFMYDIQFIPDFGIGIATNNGLFTVDSLSQKLVRQSENIDVLKEGVYKLFPVTAQHVFLNTKSGVEIYNPAANTLKPAYYIHESDTVLFEAHINQIFEDSQGFIWVETRGGSLCQSYDGIHFRMSLSDRGKNHNKVGGQLFMFEKDNGTKYYFSNASNLLSYNDQSMAWEPISCLEKPIRFIFNDQNNKIWICTRNNKIFKWTGEQWEFIIDISDRLENWEIKNVYVDDKNGIWLATSGKGIWRIYNRKWPVNSLECSNAEAPIDFEITAMSSDTTNGMWIGGYGNVYRYDFDAKALSPLFPNLKKENPLKGLMVNDISNGLNGELWIATSQGIVIVEQDGQSFKHLKSNVAKNKNISFRYVRCLERDSSGRMWIGTSNGLFLYESKLEQFFRYNYSKDQTTISSGNIQCISQIGESKFLIGYIKDGVDLLTLNPTDHSISCQKVAYNNPNLQHYDLMTANVFYQSGSDYWVGTFSKGLLKLDLETLSMNPLSEAFPIIPNVKEIQKGIKGNLWVSAIDGIRSINPEDLTYYRFTKASGLLSNQFHLNSSVQDRLGNLYFGSANGLNKIQPANWNAQDTITTPILTDFKKYDESISSDYFLNDLKSIPLSYQDDFITFEFVSPTYDNPGDVQYAYQLEGFDDHWRYCDQQLYATYTNLKPGEYTFKVRAGNKGGFLNSKTKEVIIRVTPPFWQTTWFIIFVIAVLIFAYWLVFKIQSKMRMNRLRIVSEIRKKAADDFHDELGHRLTKIVLFVESLMLQKDSFPKKSAHTLRKIQDNANELYYSTKDFIWAMNPSKDSAMDLFILLRDFGDELFADTSIQFSVKGLKEEYKDYVLNMDWKRQLVLIFKEAMNNALKHSDCNEVVLKIEESQHQLKIALVDDGKGFILNHEKFGYGLGSMINRSKKIGGHLQINTLPQKGTEVLVEIT